MSRLRSVDITDEIYLIYSQYRAVNVPINSQTEDLWREFERLEAEEGIK